MTDTAARVIAALVARRWSIAVAESLTGGLLTAALTSVPGASAVVRGGVIAYDTELKHRLLSVDAGLLAAHGAVDRDVASQMATGVRAALAAADGPTQIGVAATGVAGPASQDGRPPGTVFLGFAVGEAVDAEEHFFPGDRAAVREATVTAALEGLLRRLLLAAEHY